MAMVTNDINEAVMDLLRDLIADLEVNVDEDVEKVWLEEAERRYKDLKEEEVELIPAEEVFARARAATHADSIAPDR